MIPDMQDMKYCILDESGLVDGAHGLAIGDTEQDAWERAIDLAQDWSILRAKQEGCRVRRCAIMVINP